MGGMEKVLEKIYFVRSKKDKIIAENKEEKLEAWKKNIIVFSQNLIDAVKGIIREVEENDIASVEKKKKELDKLISKGKEAVDSTYEDCVDDLKSSIRTVISEKSRKFFQEARQRYTGIEDSRTETSITYDFEFLFIKLGKNVNHYEVRTLRTGTVKSALDDLVFNLQELLVNSVEEVKKEWKENIRNQVPKALREAAGDNETIDFDMLKTALRRVVSNMEMPNLDLGSNIFSSSYSGVIEDHDIDKFMHEVREYDTKLKWIFSKAKDEFISVLERTSKREKMSDMLFKDMNEQIDKLTKQVVEKKLTVKTLKECLSILEKTA
jgi:hypothetical protein